MAKSLITNTYRYNAAQNFVDTFSTTGVNGDVYYVFAGNHLPYENSTISTINDNVNDTTNDVYRNMIFGKQAQPTDVSLMIRKVEYTTGTVYAMYDDKDPVLSTKDFFVMVDEGGYYNIFKCLNNNNDSESTVEPSIQSIGSDGIFYSSVDGYVWKYMFSIDQTTYDKFQTEKFIPFIANTEVIASATVGSIDSIKVTASGAGYSNYIDSAYFTTSDVRLFSNSLFYGISGASGASAQDDFYKGCVVSITDGTGAGQYRSISSYEGTANTKYIVLDEPFTIDPDNTSTYSIYPGVYIDGDQTETADAYAWAYVNPVGNSIARVEMLDVGLNYKTATANVYAHISAGVTSPATVRPILSPPGGHGSSPANELYCTSAAISIKFANTEANTVPSTNQFRQIGVLLNPTYANAELTYSTSRGSFIAGETLYSFYPVRIQNHVNIEEANTTVTVDYDGVFDQLSPNTIVFVSDDSQDQLFTVNTVTNNSVLEVNEPSFYAFANATMYTLDTQAYGEVIVTAAGSVTVQNITGHIKDDSILVGSQSGAYATAISGIFVGGIEKQFGTFIETYRYTGTVLSGTFEDNELVFQTNAGTQISNAVLHSVQTLDGITNFFVTNQNGIFNTSNTITGDSSGAVATLTDKYVPEIVFGSGSIIYLENLDPITRANNETETFKLIFEF